jgi:hypothetical protein
MLRVIALFSPLLLVACGAAAVQAPATSLGQEQAGSPEEPPVTEQSAGDAPAARLPSGEGRAEAGGEARAPADDGEAGNEEPVIVQAGTLPRDSMVEVLDRGVARFLQQVDTRPLKAHGRFVGWKLLEFFPGDERFADCAVKAGDTVLRVNGRSIERPESFKTVWDSLYTARELRVLLLRAGRVYELRFAIEQQQVAVNAPTAKCVCRKRGRCKCQEATTP